MNREEKPINLARYNSTEYLVDRLETIYGISREDAAISVTEVWHFLARCLKEEAGNYEELSGMKYVEEIITYHGNEFRTPVISKRNIENILKLYAKGEARGKKLGRVDVRKEKVVGNRKNDPRLGKRKIVGLCSQRRHTGEGHMA